MVSLISRNLVLSGKKIANFAFLGNEPFVKMSCAFIGRTWYNLFDSIMIYIYVAKFDSKEILKGNHFSYASMLLLKV